MPRFFADAEGWMEQLPVIGKVDPVFHQAITAEIRRIARDEDKMSVSVMSRIATITVRCKLHLGTPYLFIRFNITNHEPVQFAYEIMDAAIVRRKSNDNIGIAV